MTSEVLLQAVKFALAEWGAVYHQEFEQIELKLQEPTDLLSFLNKK